MSSVWEMAGSRCFKSDEKQFQSRNFSDILQSWRRIKEFFTFLSKILQLSCFFFSSARFRARRPHVTCDCIQGSRVMGKVGLCCRYFGGLTARPQSFSSRRKDEKFLRQNIQRLAAHQLLQTSFQASKEAGEAEEPRPDMNSDLHTIGLRLKKNKKNNNGNNHPERGAFKVQGRNSIPLKSKKSCFASLKKKNIFLA